MKYLFLISFLFVQNQPEPAVSDSSVFSYHGEDDFELAGQWDFYWKQYFTEVPTDESGLEVWVPSQWNNYLDTNGEKLSGKGYGTYVTTIYADRDYRELGMNIPDFYTSYKLFLNGVLVAQNGDPGTTERTTSPGYQPLIKEVNIKKGANILLLQVANFNHHKGGFYDAIELGDYELFLSNRFRSDAAGMFVIGCLIMLSISMFSMFFFWQKDVSILYFAIASVVFALRIAVYELEFFSRFVPQIPWWLNAKTEYLSLYLSVTFIALLAKELFYGRVTSRYYQWFIIFNGVVCLITVFTGLGFYSRLLFFYMIVGWILATISLVQILRSTSWKNTSRSFNPLSLVLILASLFFMMLVYWKILSLDSFFSVIFYVIVFITFGLEMSRKFARAFEDLEITKNQLAVQKTQIEEQNQELKQFEKEKSRWFVNIAHELRTPVTLVQGPLKKFLDERAEKDRNEDLVIASRNADQLSNLINEILEISRMENGRINLHPVTFNWSDLVYETTATFESICKANRVGLIIDAEDGVFIEADQSKIQKVLINLLSNSIKYTPVGGEILVKLSEKDGQVKMSVSDTGEGISATDLPHIFDRFYQSADERKNRTGGSGVGLSLAKEIALMHGGDITVSSELGSGSVFEFWVPASLRRDATEKSRKEPVLVSEPQPEGYRSRLNRKPLILVVDDNDDMRQFVIRVLRPHAEIIEAQNGVVALEQLHKQVPDLIISDMMMPLLDGIGLARKVKENDAWKNISFIALTALASEEDKLFTLRIGIDDYITKPFITEELRIRVLNLLENRNHRLEAEEEAGNESYDDQVLLLLEKEIHQNIDQAFLTVSYLADKASMSERKLQRYLKSQTGLTPNQFIREIRLMKAQELLEKRKYTTISEVSHAVGIDTPTYFSEMFRARFGKNPKDFL